jgi:hypothetical protein
MCGALFGPGHDGLVRMEEDEGEQISLGEREESKGQ